MCKNNIGTDDDNDTEILSTLASDLRERRLWRIEERT